MQELAHRYKNGTISAEEKAEFENWLSDHPDQPIEAPESYAASEKEVEDRLLARIEQQIGQPAKTVRLWPHIAAAASILIGLSIGGYFLLHQKPPVQLAQNQPHDIAPGHNQATLTLANGQKIILTKGLSGKLAQQGHTNIAVNANAIAYTVTQTGERQITYNTMTTARGEQSPYPLVLADGTKVWLDAASSVTFPTAFNGKERKVTITGEAYFEVAHNAARPFKVEVRGQTIEDIGTAFNVNAYADEPVIKTTLVSGSVRIITKLSSAVLKPNQVAITSADEKLIKIKDVDIEEAMAWKNGYFLFDHESLQSIMRKISRWYDVDVIYQPGQQFTGEGYLGSMTRYTNVSQVLSVLETAGHIKFTINGKQITVTKK